MEELTMLEELEEIDVPIDSWKDFLTGVAVGITIGTFIVT